METRRRERERERERERVLLAMLPARARTALLALGVVLWAAAMAEARIDKVKLNHDSRSIILVAEPFGFNENGVIEVEIGKATVFLPENSPAADKTRIGMILVTDDMNADASPPFEDSRCLLDDHGARVLFTLEEVENNRAKDGNFYYRNSITEGNGGIYSLYFTNCIEDSDVTLSMATSLYNALPNGGRDYLSAGKKLLPAVYMVMFVASLVMLALWANILSKRRNHVQRVHFLMLTLIVFKALTLLSQYGMNHYIQKTGDPEGWNIAYYIFTFLRGLMFFTVIILLGTGYSYFKPFLSDNEKRLLMVVIPLQVLANIAIIVMDEDSPADRDWFTWRDIFHLLDIICCCAVLFPIVWSIKRLREAATTDGKAARNAEKLALFKQFYVMVVAYVYFTRIIVYLLQATLPYQYTWLGDAAGEVATLSFYVATGIKFQPAQHNPYLSLEEAEMAEL